MSIVRVRAGAADQYADPSTDDPTRVVIADAFVAPRTSSDITDRGRFGVTEGLTLFAPYGADLLHGDRVEVDGVSYEVDGDAGQWKNPLTDWEAGCEVALKRATG